MRYRQPALARDSPRDRGMQHESVDPARENPPTRSFAPSVSRDHAARVGYYRGDRKAWERGRRSPGACRWQTVPGETTVISSRLRVERCPLTSLNRHSERDQRASRIAQRDDEPRGLIPFFRLDRAQRANGGLSPSDARPWPSPTLRLDRKAEET